MWLRQSHGPNTGKKNTKSETIATINVLIFNQINLYFSLNFNITMWDDTVSKSKAH